MAKMSIKGFEDLNMFSNKNVERIITDLINESSNAAVVSVFDDKVILLDHTAGDFYFANYEFDPKNLTVTFSEFDEIEVYKEESDLNEKALSYFDEDADVSVDDLIESFKDTYLTQDSFMREITQETLLNKDTYDLIDWDEMRVINTEDNNSFKKTNFYKQYKQRIETHPLQEIKYFDWDNPIKVSLLETEDVDLINSDMIGNAVHLWKDESFREEFVKHCQTMIEDVEDGMSDLAEFFENYPQVFFLDTEERQTMLGKAIVYSDEIRENAEDLLKGISEAFDKYDVSEIKEQYIEEAGDIDMTAGGEVSDAPEVPKKEQNGIAKKLKSIAVDVENPALKRKLEGIIEELENGANEGTDPRLIKEIVSIFEV